MSKMLVSTLCVLILFLVAYILFSSRHLSAEDCLKLGSNYRTATCLLDIQQPTPSPSFFQDITALSLAQTRMDGNSYYSNNPTFHAVLRNSSSLAAQNVVAKITFYNADTATTCDDAPDDTQKVVIAAYIGAGDAKTINQIIPTAFDTSARFTWCASILGAEEVNN